jgi:hypothetical protein
MTDFCRIFSLGIGGEVDRTLVAGLAKYGHGKAEFVQSGQRLEAPVMRQVKKALQPILRNISVDWGELPVIPRSQYKSHLHKQQKLRFVLLKFCFLFLCLSATEKFLTLFLQFLMVKNSSFMNLFKMTNHQKKSINKSKSKSKQRQGVKFTNGE